MQITYGGQGVPQVYEVIAPPWGDEIYGTWVETIDYGPGQRIERWLLQPNPDREFVNIEIPPSTWIDEVIIDTISSNDDWPGGITNDDCQNATWIGEVVDMPYTTKTATNDANSPCWPTGGPHISPNVWYVYTPSCTGTATITYDPTSPCGSSYLGTMAVYRRHVLRPARRKRLLRAGRRPAVRARCAGGRALPDRDVRPRPVHRVQGHRLVDDHLRAGGARQLRTSGKASRACRSGDAQWGDLDNDGDLDLVVSGEKNERLA